MGLVTGKYLALVKALYGGVYVRPGVRSRSPLLLAVGHDPVDVVLLRLVSVAGQGKGGHQHLLLEPLDKRRLGHHVQDRGDRRYKALGTSVSERSAALLAVLTHHRVPGYPVAGVPVVALAGSWFFCCDGHFVLAFNIMSAIM